MLLVGGLLLRFQTGLIEPDVVTLLDKIEYNDVKLGSMGMTVAYLMIAFGAVIAVISIVGIGGAMKKIRCCLILVSNARLIFVCFVFVYFLKIFGGYW